MSQKKNRLIKAFLKETGMDNTGQQWDTSSGKITKEGKLITNSHVLRDDKKVKKDYANASAAEKAKMTHNFKAIYINAKLTS